MLRFSVDRIARSCLALALGLGSAAAFAQGRVPDTIAQRVQACVVCHGEQGKATSDGYFPRIAGKPAGYLYNQLLNFRDGRRTYPLMTYMLAHLSDEYLMEMAEYFASLHPPYPAPQSPAVSAAVLDHGRLLVQEGDAKRDVPACIACHGANLAGVAPALPGLLGLPRDYINSQFGAWQQGRRHAAAPDCMAQITSRLDMHDIGAISSWLAAQPVPPGLTPAAPATLRLPIPCGGVPQ